MRRSSVWWLSILSAGSQAMGKIWLRRRWHHSLLSPQRQSECAKTVNTRVQSVLKLCQRFVILPTETNPAGWQNIGVIIHWLEHNYEPTTRELQLCSPETSSLWHTRDHLRLKDGVLFYVWADRDDRSQCLVVPAEIRLRVLYYWHDSKRIGTPW